MLYIHIPFCKKKCGYCDFCSFEDKEDFFYDYTFSLCNEIELRHNTIFHKLDSIYIGGGTPSLLPVDCLDKIFSTVFKYFTLNPNAEVTMEVNPKTVTDDLISAFDHLPINRVSMGLQSANNIELNALGRIHDFNDFVVSYDKIRSKIDNISIDVMTGIPFQTRKSLLDTLELICKLRPNHISSYALSIEEGTPFFDKYTKYSYPLPDEDSEFGLYKTTIEYLKYKGYERYEISNYCKEGYFSRHNLGYWNRTPYLGVGLNASSFFENTRLKNTDNLEAYLSYLNSDAPYLDEEFFTENYLLSKNDQISEFMFLGLRKTNGINLLQFKNLFGNPIEDYYLDNIKYLIDNELVTVDDYNLKLTEQGTDISNYVLSLFLLSDED